MIRLHSELATVEQVLGTYGAQNHSVVNLREDPATCVTTQLPSRVEFIPLPELNQTYEFKGEVAQRSDLREHNRDPKNSYGSLNSGNGIRRKSIDTIMLFAAGIGSRMRHLTKDSPKTLLPILGKPLLYHSLELCGSYPFKRIIINTHYLPEKIEQTLAEFRKQNPDFPEIITIHEEELLETGGTIKNAISIMGQGPIFTLNTDIILKSASNPFEELQKRWNPDKMDFLLLVQPFDKAIGYRGQGDFEIDDDGALSRPDKKDNYSYMYAGLQILDPLKVADNPLKVFSLRQYYIDNNRVFGLTIAGTKWYHATAPEDIPAIESDIKSN